MLEETYKKSKGNAGLKGVQFQLDLLTVCLLNSLYYHKNWKISSENQNAGKYDDIVIERLYDSAILIQAKHKENKKISKDQLLSDNSKNADFSLPKYFFSYEEIKAKFKTRTVIICTNTTINTKGLGNIITSHLAGTNNILHYEDPGCSFYTFSENILPELKTAMEKYFDNNLQNKSIDKSVITDENVKDFLNNLQFFYNYASGEELHKIIDRLLMQLKSSELSRKISYHEIYRKVEDWFQQPNGEYLTENRAKAMLCEIKSDKYCEWLKDYDVSFKINNFDFNSKRVFYVKTQGGCLLQTMKIFHALEDNRSRKFRKLYVNPDHPVQIQKQMVEVFELRRYTFLIMVLKDEALKVEVTNKLKEVLEKHQYKKVIFVVAVDDENEVTESTDTCHIDGRVEFQHLSKDCQERLIKTKNFNFQGGLISLEELLVTKESEHFANSLDAETLEKLVTGEKIEVGKRILSLEGVTAGCYISRLFRREADIMGNREDPIPEDSIYGITDKVILVGDCAGMGKSIVLSKLAFDVKKRNPLLWVIKINLNEYTKILQQTLTENKKRITVMELLNSKEDTKLTNEFENVVFSLKERVVLMLDAVDEVSPDYTDLILDLLTECQRAPNFIKIFTTTRPHLTEKLKRVLKVGSFKMLPFTKNDQINFLRNYWIHNLQLTDDKKKRKCKLYADKLRAKMSQWIRSHVNQDSPFAAVPLQVGLIADIFQEKIGWEDSLDWEGCKEYISGSGTEPKLPENFNITKLYDMFIQKKRGIYINKVNSMGNPSVGKILKRELEECFVHHRSLALEVIVGKNEKDMFTDSYSRHDNLEDCCVLEIGIVQRSSDEFQFIHRTFAEYFVAKSIIGQLKRNNEETNREENVKLQKLLVEKILVNDEFEVVRTFLERFLHETIIPPNIFQQYRSSLYTSNLRYWVYNENVILVLTKEGCVAVLQFILKSIEFQKQIRNPGELQPVREINVKDWQVELKNRSNVLDELHSLIRQVGMNFKDETGTSPLLWAVRGRHLEMVKFIIRQGAYLDSTDDQNRTALHLAAERPETSILKCLVENRANLDARDGHGFTALLLVALRNEIGTFEYLAAKGADINAKDNYGVTVLHHAARWADLDTITYLVENYGINVNEKDNEGRTPLHYSVDDLDCVRYLVEEGGANVNDEDKNGVTALDLAVRNNKMDTAEYLQIYQIAD